MNSLRAELLGYPALPRPDYSVVLPNGWEQFETTDAAHQALLVRAAERLRAAHRPELLAQLRAAMARAFGKMRGSRTERFYLHTEAWAEDLILPLSITASIRETTAQRPLDQEVAALIRDRGATALRDDRRFVRWESESAISLGTETAHQYTTAYLTPVPGTERREALQLTAVVLAPGDGSAPRSSPLVSGMFTLSDAIVSTLQWSGR